MHSISQGIKKQKFFLIPLKADLMASVPAVNQNPAS
jgi:hypothetical protein